jgi:5'-phosphate synthase pdxT subunit
VRIGVLALQGAFREHILMLEAIGVTAEPVRGVDRLAELDGLVIPGGESTTIGKLMTSYGFYEPIQALHAEGRLPVWGTCAGAILVAREAIDAREDQRLLGLMPITVRRNAYGRQLDSFEYDLHIPGVEGEPFRGVFIRAPWIEAIGEGVRALAWHEDHIVAARDERTLATAFHPELTGDVRIHRYFCEQVVGEKV